MSGQTAEYIIKIDITEIVSGGMNWAQLSQWRVRACYFIVIWMSLGCHFGSSTFRVRPLEST
jgi:hypothetical protein